MKTLTVGTNETARFSTTQKILLACGVLSSPFYVLITILGGLRWQGYDPISQAVSELSAIGAPSRELVIPLYVVYNFLVIAFALGVWKSAGRRWQLRVVAGLLVVYSAVGLYAGQFASMNMRGVEATQADSMHIILTIVTVISMFVMIGLAAAVFGMRFRLYSIATILVLLVFGALAGMDGPRLAANLPTPWLGLTERINIFGFMLWLMTLAIALIRARPGEPSAAGQRPVLPRDLRRSGEPES